MLKYIALLGTIGKNYFPVLVNPVERSMFEIVCQSFELNFGIL